MFNSKTDTAKAANNSSAMGIRTRIEDIPEIGEVLHEEQLRLVEGGCKAGSSGVLTRKPDGTWGEDTDRDF